MYQYCACQSVIQCEGQFTAGFIFPVTLLSNVTDQMLKTLHSGDIYSSSMSSILVCV